MFLCHIFSHLADRFYRNRLLNGREKKINIDFTGNSFFFLFELRSKVYTSSPTWNLQQMFYNIYTDIYFFNLHKLKFLISNKFIECNFKPFTYLLGESLFFPPYNSF